MIYDLFLIFFIIGSLPKILWHKKRCPTLKERFGFSPPTTEEKSRIWIHAVSVGEVKAALPLIQLLPKETALLITTSTLTGFEEARRSNLPVRLFPLDFSWIMRRWIRSFRPQLLIFIEGDIWPNLLQQARQHNIKTALVSGKISSVSAKRLSWVPFLSRHLFGSLDLLSVQNEEHRARFASLVKKPIFITGNLKLDLSPQSIDPQVLRKRLSFSQNQPIITLSCTHAGEEQELLELLRPLWEEIPDLIIFLAPRHPERLPEVIAILKSFHRPFCRWSQFHPASLVLIDEMGQLAQLYAISTLAIVAGSFSSRIGGHNVLEPCLYGCPVLFGPHMQAQQEFAKRVLEGRAGMQVTNDQLLSAVRHILKDPIFYRNNAIQLIQQGHGSAQRTFSLLKKVWG